MKVAFTRATGAFSLVEMLVVIAIIGILAGLLLPALEQGKFRARRAECGNNLQETGIAAHSFANDHGGRFPPAVSTNDGGSLEFATAGYQVFNHEFYFSFQHFRPLANELGTPKLFACPSDLRRQPAQDLAHFDNHNLSYEIGLGAEPGNPLTILAADRGLPAYSLPGYGVTSILRIPPSPEYRHWAGVHNRTGNILFSDGHVEESSDWIIEGEESVPENLVYPDVPDLVTNPPPAGPGGGTPNGYPPPSGNPPSPGNQSPNPAPGNGPNPGQPPAPNPPSPAPSPGSSSQHSTGNVPRASSQASDEAGNNPPNPAPGRVISTNTATEPDSDDDMSGFDRQIHRVVHEAFGWLYLLALLLFLLFLLWRWWRRRQRRQERRTHYYDGTS